MFDLVFNRLFGQYICLRKATVAASATLSPALLDGRITARSYVIAIPMRGDEALGSWGPNAQGVGTVRIRAQTAPAADLPFLVIILNWRAKDDVA